MEEELPDSFYEFREADLHSAMAGLARAKAAAEGDKVLMTKQVRPAQQLLAAGLPPLVQVAVRWAWLGRQTGGWRGGFLVVERERGYTSDCWPLLPLAPLC